MLPKHEARGYRAFVLNLAVTCSVLDESWLKFLAIKCCMLGTSELFRELLLAEGQRGEVGKAAVALPNDSCSASVIHHPERMESECCLGALFQAAVLKPFQEVENVSV